VQRLCLLLDCIEGYRLPARQALPAAAGREPI